MTTLAKNKKAYFDYEILKEFNAGIILTGGEVKACREGQMDLKGAYVNVKEKRAVLKNSKIAKYKHDQTPDYDPNRDREILLNLKELHKIQNEIDSASVTLVPLSLYTQGRLLKLKLGLARGKKKYDKRESIKKRDIDRRKIN